MQLSFPNLFLWTHTHSPSQSPATMSLSDRSFLQRTLVQFSTQCPDFEYSVAQSNNIPDLSKPVTGLKLTITIDKTRTSNPSNFVNLNKRFEPADAFPSVKAFRTASLAALSHRSLRDLSGAVCNSARKVIWENAESAEFFEAGFAVTTKKVDEKTVATTIMPVSQDILAIAGWYTSWALQGCLMIFAASSVRVMTGMAHIWWEYRMDGISQCILLRSA